jgi:hypothetical protein
LVTVASAQELLLAYDQQLRTDAETTGAVTVDRLGPLFLITFEGGRGFVTYRDLEGTDAEAMWCLIRQVLDHYRPDPAITSVEWKTRGHDHAPGLYDALEENGFAPDEPESIMIGDARMLDVSVPLPPGVVLRRVTREGDIRATTAMQDVVFGSNFSDSMTRTLLRRLVLEDGMELWVAEAEGQIVCAGHLDPVAGTDFAGIWGGATLVEWRGRGIYRALTAARARSALAMGKSYIHSDSTEYSRPILERSGLLKVSTTTPYRWSR